MTFGPVSFFVAIEEAMTGKSRACVPRNFIYSAYMQEVECPVLAITGGKDMQVPPEHVKRIPQLVKGEAEWHIIPGINYIFRQYEGQHTILRLIKEYKTQINEPIDPALLGILDEWLERFKK